MVKLQNITVTILKIQQVYLLDYWPGVLTWLERILGIDLTKSPRNHIKSPENQSAESAWPLLPSKCHVKFSEYSSIYLWFSYSYRKRAKVEFLVLPVWYDMPPGKV